MMAGLLSPGQSHALPLGTQRSSRLPIPGPQPDVGRMRSPRDGQQVAPTARRGRLIRRSQGRLLLRSDRWDGDPEQRLKATPPAAPIPLVRPGRVRRCDQSRPGPAPRGGRDLCV